MGAVQALYYNAFSAALIQVFFTFNFCEQLLILNTPSMRVSERAMLVSPESVEILGNTLMGEVKVENGIKIT